MIERVMEEFFADNRPATTIVQTPTDQTDPNVSLLVDAVAVASSSSSLEVERINLPGYEDATPGYPQATRVEQFVTDTSPYPEAELGIELVAWKE